jgi:dihydropteroate synthase
MGILNVTPDSFSDGGKFIDHEVAIQHAWRMKEEGADIIDIGGESTRPGADSVSSQEEVNRVVPVISGLKELGIPLSIDTMKASVAEVAIREGASIVNDVTALRDPAMAPLCAGTGVTVVLMHMRGEPRTMQVDTTYEEGILPAVTRFLLSRLEYARFSGINPERIWIDPGIGFGKDLNQNLELIAGVNQIAALGYPVLVGASRKSFISRLLTKSATGLSPNDRLPATIAAHVIAQQRGAKILRVHDVKEARQASELVAAIQAI